MAVTVNIQSCTLNHHKSTKYGEEEGEGKKKGNEKGDCFVLF